MILGKLKNFIPINYKNAGDIGELMWNSEPIRGDITYLSSPTSVDIEAKGHSGIHSQYNRIGGCNSDELTLTEDYYGDLEDFFE